MDFFLSNNECNIAKHYLSCVEVAVMSCLVVVVVVVAIPVFFADSRPCLAKELSHVLHPGLTESSALEC